MKRISPVIVVGLALTAACCYVSTVRPPFIQWINNFAYDYFMRVTARPVQSNRVAIVDVDDASLAEHGQWPWPRYLVAQMTQKLFAAGASVVAFDVVFPEADRTSPKEIEKDLERYLDRNVDFKGMPEDLADFDSYFANVLEEGRVILGCSMHWTPSATPADPKVDPNYWPYYQLKSYDGTSPERLSRFLLQASTLTVSIPKLREVCEVGFFNAVTDNDSIVRSNPLIWTYGNRLYPSLALEAIRIDGDLQPCNVHYDHQGAIGIQLRHIQIPTDDQGRLVIKYRTLQEKDSTTGFQSSFPTYSAMDVLSEKAGSNAFAGKIVFVGTSAIGLKDVKATPLTQFFSGVETHATIVDNILSGDILKNPLEMRMIQPLIVLSLGVFLTILIARARSWVSFITAIAAISLGIIASGLVLQQMNIVFVPTWIILTTVILYIVLTVIRFWQEELQKKRVRNMFGTMVSSDVLQYLEDNPGSFSLSGEKAEATILFSDVAGFTSISETLEPARLSDLLNRYLSPMTQLIMARHGYVDKYEGDAIMAEWGVPFPMEDHAKQACLSALEQQRELKELRPWLKKAFGHDLHVRMGINSGTVTAGNMGSEGRMQYTVMGDAVNLAARFEPANKDYRTLIIIGEHTYMEAAEFIEVRLLDRIVVMGKKRPIGIYELLSETGGISDTKRRVVQLYEEALQLHWESKWDPAIKSIDEALKLDRRDTPSANMKARIENYRINPPDDTWTGEYVRLTKD